MQLAARQLFLPASRTARRSLPRQASGAETSATQLAKRAGATQDRALYTCHCGFAWTDEVSTSIGCPNCGDQQAW